MCCASNSYRAGIITGAQSSDFKNLRDSKNSKNGCCKALEVKDDKAEGKLVEKGRMLLY